MIGTVIVSIILIFCVILVILKFIDNKKKGKSYLRCNNSCPTCPFSESCHKINTNKFIYFNSIDSTNLYAKNLFKKQKPEELKNTVIVAETQTAGRGRLERKFYSPKGGGIYMSIIYIPKKQISDPAKITAFTAVAVKRVIKKFFNVDSKIKWINDLYYNEKKIAGILTEGIVNSDTNLIDAAVIGIGINVFLNKKNFPEELSKIIGSITDKKINKTVKKQFVEEIATEVLHIFSENHAKIIEEYKKDSFILGTKIQVHPVIGDDKSIYEAVAVDIDDDAGLVVKLQDGSLKTLCSGEVSLHKDN